MASADMTVYFLLSSAEGTLTKIWSPKRVERVFARFFEETPVPVTLPTVASMLHLNSLKESRRNDSSVC